MSQTATVLWSLEWAWVAHSIAVVIIKVRLHARNISKFPALMFKVYRSATWALSNALSSVDMSTWLCGGTGPLILRNEYIRTCSSDILISENERSGSTTQPEALKRLAIRWSTLSLLSLLYLIHPFWRTRINIHSEKTSVLSSRIPLFFFYCSLRFYDMYTRIEAFWERQDREFFAVKHI